MKSSYAVDLQSVKPSIVEIIGQYLPLRKVGKEYTGLCPFHAADNYPLSVNGDKGLFHCFGCQESGDVIDFVRRVDGLSYREALAELGMNTTRRAARIPDALTMKARELACWANTMTYRAEAMLRDIGQEIYLCSIVHKEPYIDKKFMAELEESLSNQWKILEDIAGGLQDPNCVLELYRQREVIENILSEDCDG